jgi:hypothetical protein
MTEKKQIYPLPGEYVVPYHENEIVHFVIPENGDTNFELMKAYSRYMEWVRVWVEQDGVKDAERYLNPRLSNEKHGDD